MTDKVSKQETRHHRFRIYQGK